MWPQLLPLLFLAAACSQAKTPPNYTISVPPSAQVADVVRVIDGDTIEVNISDSLHTVRYIGIDTPETKHPTQGVEPFGPFAGLFSSPVRLGCEYGGI